MLSSNKTVTELYIKIDKAIKIQYKNYKLLTRKCNN